MSPGSEELTSPALAFLRSWKWPRYLTWNRSSVPSRTLPHANSPVIMEDQHRALETQTSRLLELPPELRIRIWEYVLGGHNIHILHYQCAKDARRAVPAPRYNGSELYWRTVHTTVCPHSLSRATLTGQQIALLNDWLQLKGPDHVSCFQSLQTYARLSSCLIHDAYPDQPCGPDSCLRGQYIRRAGEGLPQQQLDLSLLLVCRTI